MDPDRIRELRLEKGWTQEELAWASGIPQQTISGLEVGRHRPTIDQCIRLGRVLGVRPKELTGVFGPPRSAELIDA